MSIETVFLILDTLFIFGFIIGYSFSRFYKKIQNDKKRLEEYKMAYIKQQSALYDDLPKVKKSTKVIGIKKDICICGHDLKDHMIDGKNKPCYHVVKHISKDEDEFCQCKNYKEMIR